MTWSAGIRGGLMVCGTNSDAGKTTVVTGLCRSLARRGVRVAPFKAQNMALNSAVTPSGHEIGRAQAAQAAAAGIASEVAMNPILLKPTSERTSQVIVNGRPWKTLDAAAYHRAKPALLGLVLESLADLRSRYDVVLCEGAGSPTEINLLAADIVNLRVARDAGLRAIVVGDIDRGGVFAALYGTVALLPDDLRATVGGFVVNKFRGDAGLLADGPAELEHRCGVPTLGVIPFLDAIGMDAEDSLALTRRAAKPDSPDLRRDGSLDIAVIRFPRISNFTDLDALDVEDGVTVRLVSHAGGLGRPDLLILPGTKATVADLAWLRSMGLADAIVAMAAGDREGQKDSRTATTILGICGGYQMLGRRIRDDVESPVPEAVDGLGLLPVATVFAAAKVTRMVQGTGLEQPIRGYQIHHGRIDAVDPWLSLDNDQPEGSRALDGGILGTSVHGLFDSDSFRAAFLGLVAARAGKSWRPSGASFAAAREERFDRLADAIDTYVDADAIERLITAGGASR